MEHRIECWACPYTVTNDKGVAKCDTLGGYFVQPYFRDKKDALIQGSLGGAWKRAIINETNHCTVSVHW